MIHSRRKDPLNPLITLLKALIRKELNVSPEKCKLFIQKLKYIDQTILIKEKYLVYIALQSRVDVIQRLELAMTSKVCKNICGLISYLPMYLKNLQKNLIPIYNLTKKGVPFE